MARHAHLVVSRHPHRRPGCLQCSVCPHGLLYGSSFRRGWQKTQGIDRPRSLPGRLSLAPPMTKCRQPLATARPPWNSPDSGLPASNLANAADKKGVANLGFFNFPASRAALALRLMLWAAAMALRSARMPRRKPLTSSST